MSLNMLGRIVELVVTVPVDFLGALVDLLEKLSGSNQMEWFENLKKFLRKEECWVETGYEDFFRTRPGLYVDESFRSFVVLKAKPSEVVEVNHFDLLDDMSDEEVEAKLNKFGPHIWDEGVLCATLQKLIMGQWGGKSGKVLKNNRANIFYTSSCVVHVYGNTDHHKWSVDIWRRGVSRWHAGLRAFSPVYKNA